MDLAVAHIVQNGFQFDIQLLENIILSLGDAFNIQIVWNSDMTLLTAGFAVAGGLVGGYTGGRIGAALGAGLGSMTGLGVATIVSLRELWSTIKTRLTELYYIVFNYLRRLDAIDYINAAELLLTHYNRKRELVFTIMEFIAYTLGRQVLSSVTAAE